MARQKQRGRDDRRPPITKAVVPAAGRGTRLLPATRSQPKEMLPVGRKPAIQHVVEELTTAGLHEVLVVSGQGKRALEDHLDRDAVRGDAPREPWMNLKFFFARQTRPRGLADAIATAEPFAAGQPLVVALGDSITLSRSPRPPLQRMIEVHQKRRPAATILVQEVPREAISRYGIVAPKGEPAPVFPIRGFVEKPSPSEAPSNLAAAGRYVLEPVVFDAIRRIKPGIGGDLWLTDALQLLLEEGYEIMCVRLRKGERRLDIGDFSSYYRTFVEMALLDHDYGPGLRSWLRRRLAARSDW